MKNLAKQLLVFLLVFAMVLPLGVSNAAPEAKPSSWSVSLEDNELSEEQAKQLVETMKNKGQLQASKQLDKEEEEKEVRVIVEVEGNPLLSLANSKGTKVSDLAMAEINRQLAELDQTQNAVKTQMAKAGIKAEYLDSYKAIMNGFAAKVSTKDLDAIDALAGVAGVYISNEYERPEPQMMSSGGMVHSQEAWDLGYAGEGMLVAVLDTGTDVHHKDLVVTPGAKLGLTKEEAEALIAENDLPGQWATDKVPYAYNYYDKNNIWYDNGSTQHGMHVAGTIAANGDTEHGGIKGIAKNAQILSMKVFSNDILYATTFTDIYVKAIDDSILLGADAINMSLGAPAGVHDDNGLEQKLLQKAVDAGIICSISAGNERNIVNGFKLPYALAQNPDTGVLGSPSANKAAFSVASVENSSLLMEALSTKPALEGDEFLSINTAGGAPSFTSLTNEEGYDYVFVGTGKKEEWEAVGKENVQGKVAIAIRGNTFTDTIGTANEMGVVALLVYNHADGGEGTVNMAGGDIAKVPFGFMTHSAGNKLKALKEENPDAKLVFASEKMGFKSPDAGKISTFSSWGVTPDFQLKPEIAAPGGNIYSLQNNNSYTTMSGTSMAAPHVSGGVVIVKQFVESNDEFKEIPNSEISEFVQLLTMNTADPLTNPDSAGEDEQGNVIVSPYSPRQQGAGMMNLQKATTNFLTVVDADEANSSYNEGKLELGNVGESKEVSLKVKNYGKFEAKVTPKIQVLNEVAFPAGGNSYLFQISTIVHEEELEQYTVPAGGEIVIPMTLDFSKVTDRQFADGFVLLQTEVAQEDAATGTQEPLKYNLSVPFVGFKGDWGELQFVDTFDAKGLLVDPEVVLRDEDAAQPSQFSSSGFLQQGLLGAIIADPNKVVIASNSGLIGALTGVNNITPVISQLRNAKYQGYMILDKDGQEILRTLDEETDVRKLSRLDRNPPFAIKEGGYWSGQVNGKDVPDGSYTYRIASRAYYPKDAQTQFMDFHVVNDNTAPVIDSKDYGEGPNYTFDEENKTLTFKAWDVIPEGLTLDDISELQAVTVHNVQANKSDTLTVQDVGVKLEEGKDEWELTVDLKPYLQTNENDFEVYVVDGAMNASKQKIRIQNNKALVVNEGEGNIMLTKPALLTFYGGNPDDLESLNGETGVPVDGYVFGWEKLKSVTIDGTSVPFTEEKDVTLTHPDDPNQVLWEGKAFHFTGEVPYGEGYHEALVEATPVNGEATSITRRFWVDLTMPTADIVVQERDKNSDTATVELTVSDNLFHVTVLRGDSLVKKVDVETSEGFGGSIEGELVTDTVKLHDGINKITYLLKDYLYTTEKTVYVVKGDVNLDNLLAALEEAENKDTTGYTDDSVKALQEAIKAAHDVLDNPASTQEQVDQAEQALRDALAGLEVFVPSRDALAEKLEEAKALKLDKYTDESREALESAIAAAEKIMAAPIEELTQDQINDATKALTDAMAALVLKMVPVEDIMPVIEAEDVETPVGEAKDTKSFFTVTDAKGNPLEFTLLGSVNYNRVGSYMVKATATSEEGASLSKKITVFVVENDKTALNDLIDSLKDTDLEAKTEKTKAQFVLALENAKRVAGDADATKAEIQQAMDELNAAKAGLKDAADKSKLAFAVQEAEKLNMENYKPSTVPAFEEALANAKAVLANTEATADEVAKALKALNDAEDALEDLAEKDDLKAAVEEAKALDPEAYTPSTAKALADALKKAEAVLADPEASEEDVAKALADLKKAKDALAEKADKKDLEKAVDKAEDLDTSNMTPESKEAFEKALEAAKAVLANPEASEEEVANALKKLNDAKDALEEVAPPVKNGWYTTSWGALQYYVEDVALKGWQELDGKQYYFRETSGTMVTGMQWIDGAWRLFREDGVLTAGFIEINGMTFFTKYREGYHKGFLQIGPNTFYFRETSGTLAKGWQYINGAWRYFRETTGTMATGWQYIDGVWHYLRPVTGTQALGWQYINGEWYYLTRAEGRLTGTRTVDNQKYVFAPSGVCLNR